VNQEFVLSPTSRLKNRIKQLEAIWKTN